MFGGFPPDFGFFAGVCSDFVPTGWPFCDPGNEHLTLSYAAFNGEIRSIFFFARRPASQRSTARWALSQKSAELPNRRESRSAISGLTARRSRSNSFTVCLETPMALAKLDTVSP